MGPLGPWRMCVFPITLPIIFVAVETLYWHDTEIFAVNDEFITCWGNQGQAIDVVNLRAYIIDNFTVNAWL